MSDCVCSSREYDGRDGAIIHEKGCPQIELDARLYGQGFFYALHSTSRRHTVRCTCRHNYRDPECIHHGDRSEWWNSPEEVERREQQR